LLLIWLSGCAGGISSLTGGSIPIGDVDGTVYVPVRGEAVAPYAVITLQSPSGETLQTATADELGHFSFKDVPEGALQIVCTVGADEARIRFIFKTSGHIQAALVVAPVNEQVVKLNLHGPQSQQPDQPVEMEEDEDLSYTVDGESTNGEIISSLTASWAVEDSIGDVDPEGHFHAKQPGNGGLIVQYGQIFKHVNIHVNPKAKF
jgi:hypothetical protein